MGHNKVNISVLILIFPLEGIPIIGEPLLLVVPSIFFRLVVLRNSLEPFPTNFHVRPHDSHCDSVDSGVPVLVGATVRVD
jgi:hypothetical protein